MMVYSKRFNKYFDLLIDSSMELPDWIVRYIIFDHVVSEEDRLDTIRHSNEFLVQEWPEWGDVINDIDPEYNGEITDVWDPEFSPINPGWS